MERIITFPYTRPVAINTPTTMANAIAAQDRTSVITAARSNEGKYATTTPLAARFSQIAVWMHVVVVGDERHGLVLQVFVGDRRGESAHAMSAQIGQSSKALPVRGADGEHFLKLVVGNGRAQRCAARRSVFHAAHADVEVAALHRLVDGVEGHLHEFRAPAQRSGDFFRHLDIETAQLRRIAGVRLHERSPALGVAAPLQGRKAGSGEKKNAERGEHLASSFIVHHSSFVNTIPSVNDDLRLAFALADLSDAITVKHFQTSFAVRTKADRTPVSEVDEAVECAISERLKRERPDDSILGEEYGSEVAGQRRWIIDPTDATRNYIRGIPISATLIALNSSVGVVSAPALGRRWWASRGDGAFCNGRPIRVSANADLSVAHIGYDSLIDF